MNLCYKSLSLAGPKGRNQDCILEPTTSGMDWWCAVADGVGNSRGGEMASLMCIETVRNSIADGESMSNLFRKVADALLHKANADDEYVRMSSTLSVLRISERAAFVGHVGDTRINQYRGIGVMGRTRDQTEVQELLDGGVLTKHQARRYPRSNVILSAMSPQKEFTLFENEFSVEKGDRILLTSDGFHEQLQRRIVAEISSSYAVFDMFFSVIEKQVRGLPLNDDASVLALEIL